MNILDLKKHWIDGEPRQDRRGNATRIKAAHRLPSTYDMCLGLYLLTGRAAIATLISHYAPEIASKPDTNFLLEFAAYVVMGLSNAFGALADVARAEPQDVPLEELRGWLFALYWIGGAILMVECGLFQLLTWLLNREHITVIVDDDEVFVQYSVFRAKSVARSAVEDVLILPHSRSGYNVMLQHEGGLTRIASVYGDLTRPTLIKCCVERALARCSQQTERRVTALPEQAPVLVKAQN